MRGPAVETYLGSESDTAAPGRPEDVAAAVREYVTAVRAYLAEIQRNGASGREVNETHSDQIDRLIRRLFELSEQRFFAEGGDGSSEVCVVAVGGYARREMSLHSDVDILFLYHGALTPHVTAVAQQVQYWLWDAQIQVGGATRTIAETIKLARKDTSVCTAVLAPRFLVGSGVLFHRFNQALQYQLLAKPERFIADLVVATQERHASYGDSLYLLQPNIKESAGGLRDYHASYWTMQATGSSARGKNDFLHLGLLTEEEAVAYMDALDFLKKLESEGVEADLVIFDPPYSPRQIKELYDSIGLETYQEMAHRTAAWSKEREIVDSLLSVGGKFLWFNWNSIGMGKKYKTLEILLICHGAAHNDTICMAQEKITHQQELGL